MVELNQKKYLERRILDVEKCLQALKIEDYSVIETVGHNIKGNGITFGFPELSVLGKQMEMAAKSKNQSEVFARINELQDWTAKQSERLTVSSSLIS